MFTKVVPHIHNRCYYADKYLPQDEDINRLAALTPNGYITAPPSRRRLRISDRVVRDMVEATTKRIHGVNLGWGQIRLRRSIEDHKDYRVELLGDAYKLVAN